MKDKIIQECNMVKISRKLNSNMVKAGFQEVEQLQKGHEALVHKKDRPLSWNYIKVMRELNNQSKKKLITIEVADQIYIIKNNLYKNDAYELSDKLVEPIYDSIR
jgi:transcriptional regulator NrdR family protein